MDQQLGTTKGAAPDRLLCSHSLHAKSVADRSRLDTVAVAVATEVDSLDGTVAADASDSEVAAAHHEFSRARDESTTLTYLDYHCVLQCKQVCQPMCGC